tara:strand:+ start:501 stop:1133 length:633 start_codon:yes stop_codon:yes gene_type:complete
MTLNEKIQQEADLSDWMPEIKYSVFAQPDKEFYYEHEQGFIRKYKVFRAISKILKPKKIIELGTCAGSSADAYLDAVNWKVFYHGYDLWDTPAPYTENGELKKWDTFAICKDLFAARKYTNYKLNKTDTRDLRLLPSSDFVAVDAAHDYRNAYQDLILAYTARPKYMLVDDTVGYEVRQAVEDWTHVNADKVESVDYIEHINGACIITLK